MPALFPSIGSLQQRLWGKSGEERENTREHCIRNPLQPPNSPWYSSCVCKMASRKMAADSASAGYETTTSAASAGTVPVVRTREVAGVSTAWMSFTTENISFYEPLIAWHCLSKYCNACSWVPNKTPCDLGSEWVCWVHVRPDLNVMSGTGMNPEVDIWLRVLWFLELLGSVGIKPGRTPPASDQSQIMCAAS